MRTQGWRRFAWYVWDQGPGMPGDWAGRLAPSFEFVFHFNRDTRKPNKTVPCKFAGQDTHLRADGSSTALRGKDGDVGGWTHAGQPTQDHRIPDSVIRVMRHKGKIGEGIDHPAVFPVALPQFAIEAYTVEGEIVFEPFCGSGTTLLAAQRTGRVARAVEIAPEYVDVAIRRFQQNFPNEPVHLEATGQPFCRRCRSARRAGGAVSVSWLADKIALWPTDKLIPYARNARTHSDAQVAQIAASIAEFGWTNPILAGSDGVIVAGHGRLAAAQKLGLASVPVVVLDHLTATQRRALVIADNRIAENAEWDEAMLRVELADLQDEGFDLDLTGFDADALAELMAGDEPVNDGQTDEDAVPEVGETPVSRPGDVWHLGPHRLLCGDATVAASYDALLDGESVDMVFTDPPYNVNYANSAKDKLRGKDRAILNDNLGDGFYDFPLAALTPILAHCRGGIYVAMSSSELDVLQAAFRAAGGKWSTFIIWAKHTFTLGRADYQRQYEPILYGWPEGAQLLVRRPRRAMFVQIKKPQKNDLHPTMKPVELVERALRNSSRPGDVVLDPFGGSGTTLIAAEKSGRVARVMELDWKYADVIVRRWEDFTGKEAIREAADQDVCAN